MGAGVIDGFSNILTTPDMVEAYRAIVESKTVKITLINKTGKYNFRLTEAQKHQLSLVVAEFDEEIAQYLDPASSEYCQKLDNLYKLAGPIVAVGRK